ncbi:pentapeptide repeat-containing protein [Kibdelosporangium aridum]|uniref:pentapeptide repeat-containing protein n=1 Tax=Kibdelosporangium aridum TaxID=2030 RepID=UPI0005651945
MRPDDTPRASSPLGRLLRRSPPVNKPSRAELEALSAKDRQDLWDAHRQRPFHMIMTLITSIGVLFGVAFTAFGLIYTARTLQTAQEGQITDRYAKAVDQLASPAVDARLGGIYALQRLAAESPRDRLTIRNVLAAFVRHHDFCSVQPPSQQCTAPIRDMYLARTATPLPTDVEAAFSAALSLTAAGDDFADLSQTRFPRVVFPDKAQMRRVDLTEADLVFASFWQADLSGAKLSGSCLTFANLTQANLRNADLSSADFYHAQMSNADLTGADLRGADLRNITGMTPEQIQAVSVTDKDTKFGEVQRRDQNFCGPQASLGVELHPFPQ